ncbi:MAG: hypothetical protein OXG58_11680 [Gemmatimonadetes bacterium]|nr:hypothetical protein [Gemmatimonadota bacterium]MCY3944116.1 hypothetical protein [Gemmatimonadota bacterium]
MGSPGRVAFAVLCACVAVVAAAAPSHPFRLSVADMRVTDGGLSAEIRFFWDDLQFAVMEHSSDMEFVLAESPEVDSTVEGYINELLLLRVGEAPLRGRVEARGIEDAEIIDEIMWWYRLEYALPAGAERLEVQNRLLFNLFEDQRNIVNLRTLGGRERTYDFSWGRESVSIPLL